MATSGSFSTTFATGFKLVVEWTESGVDTANNQSDITVVAKLVAGAYSSIASSATKNITLTINGTAYTSTCTVGISPSETKPLMTKKVSNINHGADGSKTVSISCALDIAVTLDGAYYSTVSASGKAKLTTIKRRSTLSVSNGTLGVSQNLTVTQYVDTYTHTITYECGTASGTICEKSTDGIAEPIAFTPPEELASQNTTGTTVSVVFTIETFNGSTSVGTYEKTITCSIPDTVIPVIDVSVSDDAGYFDIFGDYVKGYSKLAVVVTPTLAFGSPIASYSTTVDGSTYTAASFVSNPLQSYEGVSVDAKVTDKRGRSGTKSVSVNVLDYTAPQITLFKAHRCESLTDGTESQTGDFAQITFSAAVTPLNDINEATYTLWYKKAADSEFTPVEIEAYKNHYAVDNGTFIFAADSGSSYDLKLEIKDSVAAPSSRQIPMSSAEVFDHWRADGKGRGFGKIGEIEDGADFAWRIMPRDGFYNVPFDAEMTVDDAIIPNTYIGTDDNGEFTLEVMSANKGGGVLQRKTDANGAVSQRFYSNGVWGEWMPLAAIITSDYIVESHRTTDATGWNYDIYASGKVHCWGNFDMDITIDQLWEQTHYYGDGVAIDYPFTFASIPICTYSRVHYRYLLLDCVRAEGTASHTPKVGLIRVNSTAASRTYRYSFDVWGIKA